MVDISARPIFRPPDPGAIAVRVFADPGRYIGQDLNLASDVQSIEASRETYREVMGRSPRQFPMPIWLFERFVGKDLTTKWRWLRVNEIDLDTKQARAILPSAKTVDAWLRPQKMPG